MRRTSSSWLYALNLMIRRLQAWRRKFAQSAAAEGRDNLHELFLFGPHG